jgi:uncharacterized protein YndB with AHSA1/START domain
MSDDPRARTLQTERLLPFAAPAIYDAFADATALATWWGPGGFHNEFEQFEFREGGAWVFVMVGPDGTRYPNRSFFEVLEPGRRLVIRHDCAPYFRLTVTLQPEGDGTRLHWAQVFDDARTAQAVQAIVGPANKQNLDRLTALLQARSELH